MINENVETDPFERSGSLKNVTCGAVFRTGLRALLKLLMALDALHVKRIRTPHHFRTFDVTLIVAVQTAFGQ